MPERPAQSPVSRKGPSMLEMCCGLCKEPIDPKSGSFRASGDFLGKSDPLRAFVGTPLHWDCYDKWAERPRFARQYVAAWVKANHRNPYWWCVHRDDDVYISVNPIRAVEEASVRLAEVGSDIRVPLPRWSAWLRAPESVTPHLNALELRVLKSLLPLLQTRFPTDHVLVDAIDPKEKAPRGGSGSSEES